MAREALANTATALYNFAQCANQPWTTTGVEVLNNFIAFKLFSPTDSSGKSLDS